jgi:hypothetical protein
MTLFRATAEGQIPMTAEEEAAFLAFQAAAAASVVPQSVTRRQALQALLISGKLSLVQPAIDAIPDATQRGLMQIEFDDSQVFERQRPALLQMAAALGMTSADLDQLFILADTL